MPVSEQIRQRVGPGVGGLVVFLAKGTERRAETAEGSWPLPVLRSGAEAALKNGESFWVVLGVPEVRLQTGFWRGDVPEHIESNERHHEPHDRDDEDDPKHYPLSRLQRAP